MKSIIKKITATLFLIFFLILPLISSAAPSKTKAPDPKVTIEPSKGYKLGRYAFFPLRLPSYIFRAATLPFEFILKQTEKKYLALSVLDLFRNEKRTLYLYPRISAGLGAGFGGGLTVRHTNVFKKKIILNTSFMLFTDLDTEAEMNFYTPEYHMGSVPYHLFFENFWENTSNENMYAIGAYSRRTPKAYYGLENFFTGAGLTLQPGYNLYITPFVSFELTKTRGASGSNISVQNVFAAASLVGYNQRSRYINLQLTLAHDTRDNGSNSERGGLRAFTFHRYQRFDRKDYNYNQYELELIQFIPLWEPRFVFVLRNQWVWQQETGINRIPFDRLTKLDVNSPLRSYDSGRFRDRGSVLINAEYRYPVWDCIDGSIFVDTGRVFSDYNDLSLKAWKYSAGAGVRFVYGDHFLFRIQGAYGSEGANIIFTASQAL